MIVLHKAMDLMYPPLEAGVSVAGSLFGCFNLIKEKQSPPKKNIEIFGSIVGLGVTFLLLVGTFVFVGFISSNEGFFLITLTLSSFFIGGITAAVVDRGKGDPKIHALVISIPLIIYAVFILIFNYEKMRITPGPEGMLLFQLMIMMMFSVGVGASLAWLGSKITTELLKKKMGN